MIRLDERTYCLGIWFQAGPHADWLGAVTRAPGGALTLWYRLRPHGQDHVRWWRAAFPGKTEDEVVAVVDDLLAGLRAEHGPGTQPSWRRLVRGGLDQIAAALLDCPHVRIEDLTESPAGDADDPEGYS